MEGTLYKKVARLLPYSSAHYPRGLVKFANALNQGEGQALFQHESRQRLALLININTRYIVGNIMSDRKRTPKALFILITQPRAITIMHDSFQRWEYNIYEHSS